MSLKTQMRILKRAVTLRAIMEADMNMSQAARSLGIHRNTIDYICEDLDINVAQLRANRQAALEMVKEMLARE